MTGLTAIARDLRRELAGLTFAPPVAHVYRPLDYAWGPHAEYLERWGRGPKTVVLVGMNPGPWGMAQTGIPFGCIPLVCSWLDLSCREVGRPDREHPRRPVEGFECHREEVSGARLWGWARDRWGTPERFFSTVWVTNYCPLLFLDEEGRNLTPDKLRAAERERVTVPCDRALRRVVESLSAHWVVGIGAFAENRVRQVCAGQPVVLGRIPHPSPASPRANRGWADVATAELRKLGIQVP
ncbi:MAG TPA: uracil-DNA glycosylase family protein [Thermoanaerobaculia bacterium]|nr:uracil-DNA glycosylase family protein [Thermoanaerobaculia bacterium]